MEDIDISGIIKREQEVQTMLERIKNDLYNEIKTSTPKGVSIVNNTPMCVVVKISDLRANHFDPSYYIPEVQAKVTLLALRTESTATGFNKKLIKFLKEKKITSNGVTTYLNDSTLSILKKYVVNNQSEESDEKNIVQE